MSNWGCNNKVDTNLNVRNGGRGGVLDQWDWAGADVKRSHQKFYDVLHGQVSLIRDNFSVYHLVCPLSCFARSFLSSFVP
jgi:hypothetical protein